MELPPFDELASMEPEELQKLQEEMTDVVIAAAPDELKPRLEGLKFKIKAAKARHISPMGKCMAINELMHESLNELRELLNQLGETAASQPLESVPQKPEPSTSADVLEFRKPK